ncbi:ankyrin repeat domain-containing protein [Legionella lytica]|uniref:Ankyrin repeat domain-containing protein n=1 Tax=Legionella lytica TaxID=96232 RepID=A0ABW8DB92_9GAMM
MSISYQQLAKELGLTHVYANASQLQALRGWCNDNILYAPSLVSKERPEDAYNILQTMVREYLDEFLPQSQSVSTPNPNFMNLTPVEWAAYRGYIKFLEEYIHNVNPKNARTPLHLVAALGNLDAVKLLLKAGAQNSPDKEKLYPIHLALCLTISEADSEKEKNINKRTEMYSLLQQAAPEAIEQITEQRQNVAHYMAIYGFDTLLTTLEQSDLIKASDFLGYTPAHLAILNGQSACLTILLKNEQLRNLLDSRGSLLHFAAEEGTREAVAVCLNAGILYQQDWDGNTPAMRAILRDNVNALSGFTREQLERERIGEHEESLLHFAVQHNKSFCQEWLSDSQNTNLSQIEDKNGLLPTEHKPEERTLGRSF